MSCLVFDPTGQCEWAVIRGGVSVAELARSAKDNGLVLVQSRDLTALETAGLVNFMSQHKCSKCAEARKHRDDSCEFCERLYALEDPRRG